VLSHRRPKNRQRHPRARPPRTAHPSPAHRKPLDACPAVKDWNRATAVPDGALVFMCSKRDPNTACVKHPTLSGNLLNLKVDRAETDHSAAAALRAQR